MLDLDGPPTRWLAGHGRPAEAVLDYQPSPGMPSYESDHGTLVVYDCLIAADTHPSVRVVGNVAALEPPATVLLSRGYGMAALRSKLVGDHELVALHDAPDAEWVWRPLGYQVEHDGMQRMGSQQELEWRWGLAEAEQRRHDIEAESTDFILQQLVGLRERHGGKLPPIDDLSAEERARLFADYSAHMEQLEARGWDYQAANARADALLHEHLNPQQRLDLAAWGGKFFVRGTINRLYRIELGNGVSIMHPETHAVLVTLCLHPERWIPHADVALATKLLIESGPEGEQEMLEGARPRPVKGRVNASVNERHAWELERDLLPAQLGVPAR